MTKTADIVIIGGGMQGMASAYYLSQKGLKTILIEQGDIANGTTSRSDGDAFVSDTNPGYMTFFAKAAAMEFDTLARDLDCDFEWIKRGCVLLIENEAELEIAKKQYEAKRKNGIEIRLMDQKEVHYDEPNTTPDIIAGLEFTEGGSLNPMLLSFGLGNAILKMGGELRPYTKAMGFEIDQKGSVAKVLTDNGDILTDKVVLAAGVWSADIARLAGINLPITAMKGDLLVVEPEVYITRRKTMEFGYNIVRNEYGTKRSVTPFMEAHGIGFLIEPTLSNNALIGFSKYPVNSTLSNNMVIRAIAKRAIRFFPILKDMNIIRTYSGVRPWTPDHEPIVSDTQINGFYISSGHCGNGIMYSPFSGKLISQMVCGEETDIDITPLSLSRFEDNIKL